MCGRFASALKPSDAWLELMQEWSDELFDRYNVSPASQIGDGMFLTISLGSGWFRRSEESEELLPCQWRNFANGFKVTRAR